MYQLRDYQLRAIAEVRRELAEVDRVLVQLPTGTGKTATFLAWLDECRSAGELGRALVIAHRRELIQQPIDRMAEHFPDLSALAGVVMADRNDVGARVIVATVQTLQSDRRAAQILAHGPITHIVIDECHHATASTYRALLDRFPGAKVLGMTATPKRADGDGLSRVFQRVAFRMPISMAIREGALVPFNALGVQLPISLAGLKETADGWEAEPLGNLLSAENVLEIVFDHWQQYAQGRQTIAFTASVAQAHATAARFEAHGIPAAAVSGETPTAERDDILRRYSRGELRMVANCQVLVEGFDAPQTSAVLMICPTKSDLAYVQKLGRGLRTAEGKADCLVLDFSPIEERDVIMAGDVLGKPRDVKQAEAKAQRSGVMCAIGVDALGEAATIDPSRLIVKVLNLLRKDALAWTVDGVYTTATLTADETLCIVMPDTARVAQAEAMRASGSWTPAHEQLLRHIRSCRLYHVNGAARHVGTYADFEGAKAAADLIALDNFDAKLSKRRADWRSKPPSTAQINFAHRLQIQIPERCTKGGLAQLITHKLTVTRAEKTDRTVAKKAMKGQA